MPGAGRRKTAVVFTVSTRRLQWLACFSANCKYSYRTCITDIAIGHITDIEAPQRLRSNQVIYYLKKIYFGLPIPPRNGSRLKIKNNPPRAHTWDDYSSGISISPSSMLDWISRGDSPFTVHPIELQVPRISLTVPASLRAIERSRIVRAMSMTVSSVKLPLCLTFLTFLRSRFSAVHWLLPY